MELRCARHTDNLQPLVDFYTGILGLEVLFSFGDHSGYAGVMLGKPGQHWHLEFTSSEDKAEHKFDPEDILVFYPVTQDAYDQIVERMEANGIQKIKAKNPYWEENGIMVKDPDGYGVIVSHLRIR